VEYRAALDRRVQRYKDSPELFAIWNIGKFLSKAEASDIKVRFEKNGQGWPALYGNLINGRMDNKANRMGMRELVQGLLWDLFERTGVDPISFVLHQMAGELPSHLSGMVGKMSSRQCDLALTPDVLREFLLRRPWMDSWGGLGRPYPAVTKAIGHYYPEYYGIRRPRPHDMTKLYFDFRERDPEAFEATKGLFKEPVGAWMSAENRLKTAVVVPMIGHAPLYELAQALGYPVAYPWMLRPLDYGKGVEGKRASVKMKMVQAALRLDPEIIPQLSGRPVLLLDDNTTDFVTWLWARKLLLDAGASDAGLVVLTQTMRHPRELGWSSR